MNRSNKFLVFVVLTLTFNTGYGQDSAYVRGIIDSLCAPRYHGRGYVENGDTKAASFIVRELKRLGTEAEVQMLPFTLGVNTFPGEMKVKIGGKTLKPGADYIIDPKSGATSGKYKLVKFKAKWAENNNELFNQIALGRFKDKLVVFDVQTEDTNYKTLIDNVYKNPLHAAGYILLTDKKLTWSVSRTMLEFPIIHVTKSRAPLFKRKADLEIEQEFKSKHTGQNVLALLPGTSDSAKTVVYTAHLDHLGRMGADTYIAGASDNASGSAMLLDLYRHYQKNRPEQDVYFIWFGGEEAGLVGSKYFVEHSPIPLDSIQFLLNLDLMGDAAKGITAVNGKVFDDHFAKLSSLNLELGLLDVIKARGPAANSDHHPFYALGVPCFFIYTMGEYKHYHDIYDVPENLPLAKYDEVFQLLVEFMAEGI